MGVRPIPEGYHTVTPSLTIRDAARAIEFYRQAFGATELMRMPGPGGKIMHAEIRIGDSIVMLSDEFPDMASRSPESLGGTPGSLFLYVEDVDAVMARATKAGAKVTLPAQEMFWGDRFGHVVDPFGHAWGIATHKEDLTPDEIVRRRDAAMGAK
jgi:PhnB protein